MSFKHPWFVDVRTRNIHEVLSRRDAVRRYPRAIFQHQLEISGELHDLASTLPCSVEVCRGAAPALVDMRPCEHFPRRTVRSILMSPGRPRSTSWSLGPL